MVVGASETIGVMNMNMQEEKDEDGQVGGGKKTK